MGGESSIARLIREPMAGMNEARASVHSLIDEVAERATLPIPRIALGGFSQGSMMALEAAVHLKDTPAAILVFSGFPLRVEEVAKQMKRHRGLQVYQAHGQHDQLLPYAAAGWLRDLMKVNGMPSAPLWRQPLLAPWHALALSRGIRPWRCTLCSNSPGEM